MKAEIQLPGPDLVAVSSDAKWHPGTQLTLLPVGKDYLPSFQELLGHPYAPPSRPSLFYLLPGR